MRKSTLSTKRNKKIIFTFIIILFSIFFTMYKKSYNHELENKIYNFMLSKNNRIQAYNQAVSLNNGDSSNTCVYFICEVLRLNNVKINNNICNTTQILDIMKREGFKKERDYKKLKPGNICFTTDESLNKNGIPTHTYIFMGWYKEGQYDYAYICDNQAKDYDNKIYHLRNIKKAMNKNGLIKEPFSFFLYRR